MSQLIVDPICHKTTSSWYEFNYCGLEDAKRLYYEYIGKNATCCISSRADGMKGQISSKTLVSSTDGKKIIELDNRYLHGRYNIEKLYPPEITSSIDTIKIGSLDIKRDIGIFALFKNHNRIEILPTVKDKADTIIYYNDQGYMVLCKKDNCIYSGHLYIDGQDIDVDMWIKDPNDPHALWYDYYDWHIIKYAGIEFKYNKYGLFADYSDNSRFMTDKGTENMRKGNGKSITSVVNYEMPFFNTSHSLIFKPASVKEISIIEDDSVIEFTREIYVN